MRFSMWRNGTRSPRAAPRSGRRSPAPAVDGAEVASIWCRTKWLEQRPGIVAAAPGRTDLDLHDLPNLVYVADDNCLDRSFQRQHGRLSFTDSTAPLVYTLSLHDAVQLVF